MKGHWQLLLLTAAAFVFWQTAAVLPLKILTVFSHEASHAIGSYLTGGSRFWTLSAGYLGSLLIGVGLLLAATSSKADRKVMALCGILLLVIAGLHVRDVFALACVIGTGIAMLLAARFLGHNPNDLILRVIGLTSLIYVPFDIFSGTIAHAAHGSDARRLAEGFGGTPQMWGALWLLISLSVIAVCLRSILGRSSNLKLR